MIWNCSTYLPQVCFIENFFSMVQSCHHWLSLSCGRNAIGIVVFHRHVRLPSRGRTRKESNLVFARESKSILCLFRHDVCHRHGVTSSLVCLVVWPLFPPVSSSARYAVKDCSRFSASHLTGPLPGANLSTQSDRANASFSLWRLYQARRAISIGHLRQLRG